ncbi:MAG: GNAT family acetyltransferase [Burkholderiaceae bacterium]
MPAEIRPFVEADQAEVIALWRTCDLTRPWNDPAKDIARKLSVQRELFLVASLEARIVATIMAGYDGHRGWINYLAVHPDHRRKGLGRRLMDDVQARLLGMGCPKINLQVRGTNRAALAFYEGIGFACDDAISLGKRIIVD